jgi:hypothetical protein
MPINNLQKDTKSSDPLLRADAIKLMTDMCSNLTEISPFVLEIIQGGLHDQNAYVKEVSLISLVKLFQNTDINYSDYEHELHENVYDKLLVEQPLENNIDISIFQTCLNVYNHLNTQPISDKWQFISKLLYKMC